MTLTRTATIVLCMLAVCGMVHTKTLVIGDIHGDIHALESILIGAQVIRVASNGTWVWTYGNNTVVQVGDLIDRGPHDATILNHVHNIRHQGRWIQLLGNHEIMNLQGDFRYAVDGPGLGFETNAQRRAYFKTTFLKEMPVIHVQDQTVFVHGGLSSPFVIARGVGRINEETRACLGSRRGPCASLQHIVWDRTYAQDILGRKRPFWQVCEDTLMPMLSSYNATTLVVGHSPVPLYSVDKIPQLIYECPQDESKRVVFADVGMSEWVLGHTPTALLLTDNTWSVLRYSL